MSTARDRLLERLLTSFGEELPPRSASLREIAARVGTSHALLRYHFGSHAGLLTAMLVAQRAQDNEAMARVAVDATFPELVERIWRLYTDPVRSARTRSFFLVVGLAAQDPEDFVEFITTLEDLETLLLEVAVREGDSAESAAVRANVAVAALRGLLLKQALSPGTSSEPALRLVLQIVAP